MNIFKKIPKTINGLFSLLKMRLMSFLKRKILFFLIRLYMKMKLKVRPILFKENSVPSCFNFYLLYLAIEFWPYLRVTQDVLLMKNDYIKKKKKGR